jgi:hypothetical protein
MPQLNDIGTKFLLTIQDTGTAVDLSTTTAKTIKFRKPSGTVLTKTASFNTDGVDGKIYYTSVSGDLNEVGRWTVQAVLTFGTLVYSSDVGTFLVGDNL